MSSYSFTKVGSEYQMGVFPNDDEYTGRETQIEVKYIVAGVINTFPPEGKTSHISRLHEFVFAVHGNVGSPGRKTSRPSRKISTEDLQDAYAQRLSDNQTFQNLLGLQYTPTHVTGIVIRPLSYYF